MPVGPSAPQPVPVIALTGHLGAGKTTVLNALLAAPGARLGVIVNDIPSFRVDNMPYGGIKRSGLGREGLRYAIEDMTEVRLMVMRET